MGITLTKDSFALYRRLIFIEYGSIKTNIRLRYEVFLIGRGHLANDKTQDQRQYNMFDARVVNDLGEGVEKKSAIDLDGI